MEAGVNVVGRTRFCVHPKKTISKMPVVGGTKNLNLETLIELSPDAIVLDKEENTKEMSDLLSKSLNAKQVITHVKSVLDMPRELKKLSGELKSQNLHIQSDEWGDVIKKSFSQRGPAEAIPGVIKWVRKPDSEVTRIIYLIWHNPWMCVSKDTYIGSVFNLLGYEPFFISFKNKYPEIDVNHYDDGRTLFLASSEPFPFLNKSHVLDAIKKSPVAIVDGEGFSWFGIRGYRFLKKNFFS